MKNKMLCSAVATVSAMGLAVALVGCCGGGKPKAEGTTTSSTESPSPAKTPAKAEAAAAKLGETITFDDSTWVVVSAKDAGQTLKSNNSFQKPAKTDGKYIMVNFKITNRTSKEERLLDGPKVVDAQGREFKHIDMEQFYVPKDAKTLMMEAIPAGMTREFWGVFEVPSDATQLKFQVRSLGLLSTKRLVELAI